MKDLLSKENYCHKIHTLSIKGIAYPTPSFLQKNLDVPFNNFSKKGEVHTMEASSMEATPFKPQFLPQ